MNASKPRPRIGIFTRPIDQGTSGSGHHLLEIVTRLLQRKGEFEFFLIHYEINNKPLYRLAEEILIPRNPLRASALLRRHDFDLLHYSPLTVYAPVFGLRARKVATIHGAEQALVPRYYSPLTVLHEFLVFPHYARGMDHIITVSQTSSRYFQTRLGIPGCKISICPNAVSAAYRVLGPGPFAAMRTYGTGEHYFFHLSKYSERKNPWTMLKAFESFLGSGNRGDYRLVLAGSGWDNPRVRKALADRGLRNQVLLPGFIPESEVVELLNGATAFLYPSFAEGFGMPNLEAMACGCPVITTAVFAIPEIVDDAALLMRDPRDDQDLARKMELLASDAGLRRELIAKGLKQAACFSWDRSVETLLDVYRNLLATEAYAEDPSA